MSSQARNCDCICTDSQKNPVPSCRTPLTQQSLDPFNVEQVGRNYAPETRSPSNGDAAPWPTSVQKLVTLTCLRLTRQSPLQPQNCFYTIAQRLVIGASGGIDERRTCETDRLSVDIVARVKIPIAHVILPMLGMEFIDSGKPTIGTQGFPIPKVAELFLHCPKESSLVLRGALNVIAGVHPLHCPKEVSLALLELRNFKV